MDHLPLEVHLKVSSYLSLNQLAHCRLVSHSFKIWAEARMQLITHLELCRSEPEKGVKYELRDDWDETVEAEMQESYVQHTFFSKPFVTAVVAGYRTGSRFYAFLGKFCPNLQVLDGFVISCENLALLGSKLQLFTCNYFSPARSDHIAPSSLDLFLNLKGLISSFLGDSKNTMDKSLIRKLLQLDGPICIIDSNDALDEEIVKLLARGGIKCLHFHTFWRPPAFSLPQSLAESLVELSVDCVPTVKFCPFPLPNLLYLTISPVWHDWPATVIVSAPNLRCLTCGADPRIVQSHFVSFVHSFNQLRVLYTTRYYGLVSLKDKGDVPQEKVKISLPTSLEKITFETNIFLELVDYYSTSLKYLVVESMVSSSFVCPNLKVLICRRIELDPASLSRLLHSLSQCEKLAKLALVFSNIHMFVSLQPLIDLLSSITGLTHIKLSAEYHSPTDSIRFEQQKFPSLNSLHLKLPNTKIVFHLDNSFAFCELGKGLSSFLEFLKLNGPNKNYSVLGHCIEVLCNEELYKLVEVTLHQDSYPPELRLIQSEDTSGSQDSECLPLHGDTKAVSFCPWLLGLFNSRVNSDETELGRVNKEEIALNMVLPPKLKQFDLHLTSSLADSLRFSSSTLEYLSISHVHELSFDLPGLREVQFRNWFHPLDDTLATQSNALTSMSFHFDHDVKLTAAVIKCHLKTASKLKHLTTLEFLGIDNWSECLESVRIRQEDFPSVKKFIWTISLNVEFHPEDKFTELIIRDDSSFEFFNKEQEYEYKFGVGSPPHTWSIELPQSGMAQLSHLDFRARPWYRVSRELYLQLVDLVKRLTQVKHIKIQVIDNSDKQYRAHADAIVEWLSSLTTLIKVQGYMHQTRLKQFLRQTRTAGPLELVISKDLVPMEDAAQLDEELHRIVNDLMVRKVISKFSHPAKCSCQVDCSIKGQPGHCLL